MSSLSLVEKMKSERDEMVKTIDEIKDGIENEFQGNMSNIGPDNICFEVILNLYNY